VNQLFKKRFIELEHQASQIEASRKKEMSPMYSAPRECVNWKLLLAWKVKVKNFLSQICGEKSQYFKQFEENESSLLGSNHIETFLCLKTIFIAAKEDFEGGYFLSIVKLTQAEVFDSELEQAKALFDGGYYVAAAVIAGTVLETSLRQMCDENNIEHGSLNRMNDDLAKSGAYNVLIKKRVTVWADIRNSAAHGKPDNFKQEDVDTMIRNVNSFLVDHLKN
jgi:hypothetical protein